MSVTEGISATAFEEGTRTGDWFAMGDVNQDPSLELAATDLPRASRARRTFVRVLGCLIIGVLNNGLILLNVSPFWQQVVKGVVIVVAVAIDRRNNRAD